MISLFLLQALVAQADPSAEPNLFQSFGPFLIIMVIFYFLIFAPQRKAMKEKDVMRKNIKKNDAVVTESGIHGEIAGLDEATVTLRIAPKVEIVVDRGTIARVTKGAESK